MISLRQWSVKTKVSEAGGQKIKTLVKPISFDLGLGAILGVYGPNGSGKTSLLKSVSGILDSNRETSGEFWIGKQSGIIALPPNERVKQILYLGSEFATPFDLTVRELFEMGAMVGSNSIWPSLNEEARKRINRVVDALHLAEFLGRTVNTLSDGEKQMVMFARVLVQQPKVVVLDESFSKLDLDHLLKIAKVTRTFAKEGTSFIITSHDLNFLSEVADELLFMKKSEMLAKGFVQDLFTSAVLEELYPGLALQVVLSPESGKHKILY